MGKSTISMAIFNSYVNLPEGNPNTQPWYAMEFPACLVFFGSPACKGRLAGCEALRGVLMSWAAGRTFFKGIPIQNGGVHLEKYVEI